MRHIFDRAWSDPASGAALRIALTFFICSIGWIAITDGLLPALVGTGVEWVVISRVKGSLFMVVAAALLFVLCRRQYATLARVNILLEQQKNDFRAIFSANPHAMWIYDVATLRMMLVNLHAVQTYGYTVREFLSMSVRELRPAEDQGGFLEHVAKRAAGDRPGRWRHQRKDGSTFFVEVESRLTEFEGRPARFVTAVDITQRLEAEQNLRLAQAAFQSMREATIITDEKFRLVEVNPAFMASGGYAAEECVGRYARSFASLRHDRTFFLDISRQVEATGYWQGEVWQRRRNGSEFATWMSISAVANAAGRVRNYIGIAGDLSERKEAEERIHKLAHYDQLTLLPNRIELESRLRLLVDLEITSGAELSVLLIDIDHLRRINDSLGHTIGDAVVVAAAERLGRVAPEPALVARWGGDVFAIVLPHAGAARALELANHLLRELAAPCRTEGYTVSSTASVGISVFPRDGSDATELLRHAGAAVHYAKDQGRNCARFFRAEFNAALRERHDLENALRLALAQDELEVHYQPQISLANGVVVGMEALLRWRSPAFGLVAPGKFIPIAESLGLMGDIGAWVTHKVCEQGAIWRAGGSTSLRVAVNMSAVQLRSPGVVTEVRLALDDAGFPADGLEIEITESLIVDPSVEIRSRLDALEAMGVRLSIDDFGTGYSSLSYLRTLPVHAIKIDQSFVRGMLSDARGLALPRAIIDIGHNFEMRVVAEGVETPEQTQALLEMGCDEGQGYLFARPMTAEAATEWLRMRDASKSARGPILALIAAR